MLRSAIDELFAKGRDHAEATPSKAEPTLARAYLAAMRAHERRFALLHWAEERWQETPDWRLDRSVIRLGLYLRERIGVKPAERIAIVAPVCHEWAFAELASLLQGAVPIALDPALPQEVLAATLEPLSPVAAFAGDEAALARLQALRSQLPGLKAIIAFAAEETGGDLLLSEVLDLGGTLDTPEHAQAFRARAREIKPEAEALGVFENGRHSEAFTFRTHQDAAARVERMWFADPARPGDVTYLAHGPVSQAALIALLAAVSDGLSVVAFGTEGNEAAEIAALSPHRIVASARALQSGLSAIKQRAGRRRRREVALSALGGRARWVHPIFEDTSDAAALAPLSDLVTLDTQSQI